ncbi:porin family protein [Mucilaginibacter auburnensis]|uniref:Outer membrane protein with beta-barrel domain n=1 Tax=Mucilaginibacter auburnensis TaxID=1457233 RepID=A0A2H9VVI6_9SPHI|nr:porin family protein [Mucilaginibacter auburnensis]PJJ84827.1 outer membrane protein with beta-barrel domain [Mucilaginibacter auburnensis]
MRKILAAVICCVMGLSASAQILPKFQFGVKGGVNLTSLSKTGTFSSDNRAGYLGGVWARIGALGFNVQPEAYVTSKNVVVDGSAAKFTSLDVPVLFGGKVGALGFGARFYTGPLFSFAINKDQNFSAAASNASKLNYKDQNFAWTLGAGLDIQKISVDLRYEKGLSSQSYDAGSTKINLFNLSLGYRIF